MLPFALKVVWICLSSTGTIACWVVLYMFSRVIGSYWGPGLYSVFATLMQGIFCLGMIYDMNPFRMPKTFCIVQTFVIYYSAWSLSGVCAALTFATSSTVLWPLPMKRSVASTLAWKHKYYLPILIFPLACLSVSLPVLLSVNAIKPTDDLHCDASQPEWGRFLGYAGFSLILTIPCLFMSAVVVHRVLRMHCSNQRSQYSFKISTGHLQSSSQQGNEWDFASERPMSPVFFPDKTKPGSVDPEALCSAEPTVVVADGQSAALYSDPSVLPSSTPGAFSSSQQGLETRETSSTDVDDELDRRRYIRDMMLPSMTRVAPPPKPNLAPAIWRLILFQMAFFVTQCLATLSTVIDVVRNSPMPTPFGSQHVALVLVSWGPVVLFGYLPSVRRQWMFWKK